MSTYLTVFGKPRYLGLVHLEDIDAGEADFSRTRWVVLKTARGVELGVFGGRLTDEQEEKYRRSTAKFEDSQESMLQEVEYLREADGYRIEVYYKNRADELCALLKAREILKEHSLEMKLVDAEYMLDRKKLYFYFTAGQRIDFREYVRALAHEFKTRIEMRQIGTRDEARITCGLGSCGRPCCCSYWLRGFSPIGIRMVKEQRIALNPTKISGLCGRLMCCMSYEQSLYSELWAKLPGPGAKIKTEHGSYVLESLDIGREYVHIRFPSGRLIPVLISEFSDFQEAVLSGREWTKEAQPKPVPLARKPLPLHQMHQSFLSKSAGSVQSPNKAQKEHKEYKGQKAQKARKGQKEQKEQRERRQGSRSSQGVERERRKFRKGRKSENAGNE